MPDYKERNEEILRRTQSVLTSNGDWYDPEFSIPKYIAMSEEEIKTEKLDMTQDERPVERPEIPGADANGAPLEDPREESNGGLGYPAFKDQVVKPVEQDEEKKK